MITISSHTNLNICNLIYNKKLIYRLRPLITLYHFILFCKIIRLKCLSANKLKPLLFSHLSILPFAYLTNHLNVKIKFHFVKLALHLESQQPVNNASLDFHYYKHEQGLIQSVSLTAVEGVFINLIQPI